MKLLARILVIPILCLSFGIVSCDDDDDDDPPSSNLVYKATLTGGAERPDPTPSTATGSATLNYNDDTNIFTIMVTYEGLTPILGHVHKAPTGEAGPIVFGFPENALASPIHYTSPALTAEQETDLKAGLYYVNLHTVEYPAGEIRGQLLPQGSGGGY